MREDAIAPGAAPATEINEALREITFAAVRLARSGGVRSARDLRAQLVEQFPGEDEGIDAALTMIAERHR